MIKVLFVCTGNICRSSGAEAVLRHKLAKNGLSDRVYVESAGTHRYHIGEPPDIRGVRASKKRGVSMEGMTARQVKPEDFQAFDHIIAMDQGHYKILSGMKSDNPMATLTLFMDYCSDYDGRDVPDPYYEDNQAFEDVLDILEDGVEGILNKLIA